MKSFLLILGSISIFSAGVMHMYFFKLESIDWIKPKTWKSFGLPNQEHAEIVRPMAFNQGFYNLFLALGAIIGTALLSTNTTIGFTLMIFSASSMALAGLVLFLSVGNSRRAAMAQALPPLFGILLILLALGNN